MIERKSPPLLHRLPFMTPWYGPKALAQTGLRAVVSHTIGGYADQRILQAAIDNVPTPQLVSRYDFSALPGTSPTALPVDTEGAVWFDYLADTGDGFDSTYAMARLVSQPSLTVAGVDQPLPAGHLLFLGGDQAYPFASSTEYEERFLQPFNFTTWHAPEKQVPSRKVFVLPGNHDWYDGLSAFDRLFCSRRDGVSSGLKFGNFHCQQHRSYWAVKLPHNWWVWGIDIQLTSSLDAGQMRYFSEIARSLETKNGEQAKIIMCLATPSWVDGSKSGRYEDYTENLRRVVNIAIDKANVCLMIAGDWHHYARYFSPDFRLNAITSGGGGAYLAPTHQLSSTLHVPWKTSSSSPLQQVKFTLNAPTSTDPSVIANTKQQARPEAVYPSRSKSRQLSWLIPAFPVWNPTFCLALGFLYFLMYWLYSSATNITPLCPAAGPDPSRPFCPVGPRFRTDMDEILIQATGMLNPLEHLYYLFSASRWQPVLAAVILSVFGMIYGFLAGSKGRFSRVVESLGFWLLHVFVMAYMTDFVLSFAMSTWPNMPSWQRILGTSAFMWIIGGGIAGAMCGAYLFIGNRIFGTHDDNAFSSIRVAGYKNFLRMRITRDTLTIYPIGLDKVPGRGGWRQPSDKEIAFGEQGAYVPRKPLEPHLIEGPIVIRADQIRQMQATPAAASSATPQPAVAKADASA